MIFLIIIVAIGIAQIAYEVKRADILDEDGRFKPYNYDIR